MIDLACYEISQCFCSLAMWQVRSNSPKNSPILLYRHIGIAATKELDVFPIISQRSWVIMMALGDGKCHYYLNTAQYKWDMGDCCGPNVKCFSNPCECKDPQWQPCVLPDEANDWYCDDENNTPGCGYDGGACCDPAASHNYCTECKCKETTCRNSNWIGDGYCDDLNNWPHCNFDGGDCCGSNVKKDYCAECACKQP